MPDPFTEQAREKIMNRLHKVEADLAPHSQSLTPEERKKMLKMRDKSLAFVTKTIEYANDFPSVIPAVLNIEKLQIEYEKAQEMDIILRKLETLHASVRDSRMVAGENAYMLSLKVYQAFKVANNLQVPGISAVIEELGKQFTSRPNPKKASDNPFPEVYENRVRKQKTPDEVSAQQEDMNTEMS